MCLTSSAEPDANSCLALKAAFEILGIPTWHWVTQAENPPDLHMWADVLRNRWEGDKKPVDRETFDHLLGHRGAVTDQPPAYLPEDLIAAYPEAKVVLHERDVDRWYTSFSNTVIRGASNPFVPFATMMDKGFIGPMALQFDLITKHYFNVNVPRTHTLGLLNNSEHFVQYRRNAKDTYRAHYERVKRATPPERLLRFQLEDGWEPLCKFLGKPVPDVPFPRVNDTAALQELVNALITESYRRSAMRFLKKVAPVLVVLLAAIAMWRRMSL